MVMMLSENYLATLKSHQKSILKIMTLFILLVDMEQFGTFMKMKNFTKSQEKSTKKEEFSHLSAMDQLSFVT